MKKNTKLKDNTNSPNYAIICDNCGKTLSILQNANTEKIQFLLNNLRTCPNCDSEYITAYRIKTLVDRGVSGFCYILYDGENVTIYDGDRTTRSI